MDDYCVDWVGIFISLWFCLALLNGFGVSSDRHDRPLQGPCLKDVHCRVVSRRFQPAKRTVRGFFRVRKFLDGLLAISTPPASFASLLVLMRISDGGAFVALVVLRQCLGFQRYGVW